MPQCNFNKVAKQLYSNHTSAWVFSCKFAAYFRKHLFLRTPLQGCFCKTKSKADNCLAWAEIELQLLETTTDFKEQESL